MSKHALKLALEGLSDPELGGISGMANEVDSPFSQEEQIPELVLPPLPVREEMVAAVSAQLESHYENSDEVICHADELNTYIEENAEAHAIMREEIKDLRGQIEAVNGTMEMLAVTGSMESIDASYVNVLSANIGHLARISGRSAPSLEAVDGHLTEASMEGLIDFLKAGADKIKNWFKDYGDRIRLDEIRQAKSTTNYAARVRRLQAVIDKLPTDLGRPVQAPFYKDVYLASLFSENTVIKFDKESLATALKVSTSYRDFALTVNAKEHLTNVNAISSVLPHLLMSIGNDGGEKATKEMVEKVKLPESLTKFVTYGKEVPGGITYRESTYRPSIRVASWAQSLVEIGERDRLDVQLRRTGRATIDYCDIPTIESTLNAIAEFLDQVDNNYNQYRGDLVEAYNDAVTAYNKTLGLARAVNHSDLTSEVWKAIDLASYVMMHSFHIIQSETWDLSIPSLRMIDGILYVFEEQLLRYVKVNR